MFEHNTLLTTYNAGGTNVLDRVLDPQSHVKPEPPKMYRVLLHNDDTTPPDFVVRVLRDVFKIEATEAVGIMLSVHNQGNGGLGVIRIYPKDVAETKVDEASAMISREYNHFFNRPMELRITCKPEN